MFSTSYNNKNLNTFSPLTTFLQWLTPKAVAPAQVCLSTIDLEVASSLDAFMNIEDVVPGMDWQNLLAATWGLPAVVDQ
jgi:hypothetical protein